MPVMVKRVIRILAVAAVLALLALMAPSSIPMAMCECEAPIVQLGGNA